MKIIDTGYCGDNEYLFKTLILDDISQNITDEFIAENDISFILCKQVGYIELNHYSAESNYDNILKKGLLMPDKSNLDNVLDFGVGIYAIDSTTEEGEENIKNYLENYEDEYIAEFNIKYDGEYFECIYGEGHVGYVLITQNIKPEMIDNADVLSVNDFLYSYDDF